MGSPISPAQIQALLSRDSGANAQQISQQMSAKFQALLERGTLSPPQTSAQQTSVIVEKLVQGQESAFQRVSGDMNDFTRYGDSLSMRQFISGSLVVAQEMTFLQVDMETKMAVVNSSKQAIETLMQNQ